MNPHEVHQLAEKLVGWSNDYSTLSEELALILTHKAMKWATFRAEAKSDKAADKAWDATPEGLREMQVRLKLKALEKQMSAARTMIRVANEEARNQF